MGNNESLNHLIDLELAKSNNKKTKVKKFLPAIVFVASFYYSALLAVGLAVGYFGSKIFFRFFVENAKIQFTYIDCGKWKLHLHHWILGFLVLGIAWFVDFHYLPSFFAGVVLGVMAHDIYDFNDWHKVLVKNEEKPS